MKKIPIEIEKYFLDSFNELIKVEGDIEKISSYGGSLNIKFQSNKNYRLSLSLRTGEVTLDEILKTSEEWKKEYKDIQVYDPDGVG